jgi:hypothetical protein
MFSNKRKRNSTWSASLTGEGEAIIELPRGAKVQDINVVDMPGAPAGSNYSDPTGVKITFVKTRWFWNADLVVVSWNVVGTKMITVTTR